MMTHFTLVRPVNFKEIPSLKPRKYSKKVSKQVKPITEDEPLIKPYKENLKEYCKYLLSNIKKMEIRDIEDFINELLTQTVWPICWLNNLEKLINLNLLLLEEKANPLFLSTFHIYIDGKRKELLVALEHEDGMNIRRSNGTYSFRKLKFHLSKIDGFNKKKLFLTKCKIEYLQLKPRYIANGHTPFDEKIDLEIQRITTEEEFNNNQKEQRNQSPIPTIQKIKINSQINQFADIIYQMINDYKIETRPLIETSNANVAKLIAQFFTDANGINIEQSTIETYLQKNKPEKRPKEYNRIRLT